MSTILVSRLLDGHLGSVPLELVKDGDLLLLVGGMLHLRGLDTVRITKVKGHADEGMVLDGRVRELDKLGNDAADEAADFGRGTVSNAVIDARRNLSGFVVAGTLFFLIYIGSSLPFLEQWSTMMIGMVLLQIPWFGLLVPSPKDAWWSMRFGIGHSCPGHLVFGTRDGLMCLLLLFVLRTLLIGPTLLLVSWSSGFPF